MVIVSVSVASLRLPLVFVEKMRLPNWTSGNLNKPTKVARKNCGTFLLDISGKYQE